jgi:hypothetical protein
VSLAEAVRDAAVAGGGEAGPAAAADGKEAARFATVE